MRTIKTQQLIIFFIVMTLLIIAVPAWFFVRTVNAERVDGDRAFLELAKVTDDLDAQGHYDEAAIIVDRHLEILSRTFKRHKYVAMATAQLGKIYSHQHKYLQALDMFRQAEQMMKSLRMEKSPEMVRIYRDIAQYYSERGQFGAAVTYGQKAVDILKRYPQTLTAEDSDEFTRRLGEWQKSVRQ